MKLWIAVLFLASFLALPVVFAQEQTTATDDSQVQGSQSPVAEQVAPAEKVVGSCDQCPCAKKGKTKCSCKKKCKCDQCAKKKCGCKKK